MFDMLTIVVTLPAGPLLHVTVLQISLCGGFLVKLHLKQSRFLALNPRGEENHWTPYLDGGHGNESQK